MVYTKIEKLSINHNVPYGFFNRTSWGPQIDTPLIDIPREKWDKNQLVLSTGPTTSRRLSSDQDKDLWIDLVVNNLDDSGHPFHMVCFLLAVELVLSTKLTSNSTATTSTS